jgi:Domain of unknown function (DUF4252)
MKRTSLLMALVLLPLAAATQAAPLKMPNFSGLADKARESVDISLDRDMLKTAGGFMSGGKGENDAEFAELVKGLDGVHVKVFSFDQPGMYSAADIESVVKQVETQGWKKLLSVREKNSRVEMWMRDNSTDGGMFFVASEPNELVMINIAGKVDLETLSKLQGRMGVPNMPGLPGGKPAAAPAPPAPPAPAGKAAQPAQPAAPPRD